MAGLPTLGLPHGALKKRTSHVLMKRTCRVSTTEGNAGKRAGPPGQVVEDYTAVASGEWRVARKRRRKGRAKARPYKAGRKRRQAAALQNRRRPASESGRGSVGRYLETATLAGTGIRSPSVGP